jgi:hypothetical protein
MLNRLLEFSVRQRVFVLLATVVRVGIGVYSALRLPIDAVPDITNVQVQSNTQGPALAPEEIEKLVTFPIETEMGGIAGMTELRSLSRFGLSQVTPVFEDAPTPLRLEGPLVNSKQVTQRGHLEVHGRIENRSASRATRPAVTPGIPDSGDTRPENGN